MFLDWGFDMKKLGAEPGECCALCGSRMNAGAVVCGNCGANRKINAGFRGYAALLCNLIAIGIVLIAALSAVNNEEGVTGVLLGILVGILLSAPFLLLSWLFNLGGEKRVLYIR